MAEVVKGVARDPVRTSASRPKMFTGCLIHGAAHDMRNYERQTSLEILSINRLLYTEVVVVQCVQLRLEGWACRSVYF